MITKGKTYSHTVFLATILVAMLALVGCTADAATPLATDAPLEEETLVPTMPPTDVPATDTPAEETGLVITLSTDGIINGYRMDTLEAVEDAANSPYWEVLPEHFRLTLESYPLTNHLFEPQIFIYPVDALAAMNEGAAANIASLQNLIQSPQEITPMPMLPLFNAGQAMHIQVQYLDFQNGRGVRYVTMLSQGIVPINNYELIYTYQGLTVDGKYYVAAILPLNHADLPADGTVTGNEPAAFTDDFAAYLAEIARTLNQQSADTFSPDLTVLDALMSSLEVK